MERSATGDHSASTCNIEAPDELVKGHSSCYGPSRDSSSAKPTEPRTPAHSILDVKPGHPLKLSSQDYTSCAPAHQKQSSVLEGVLRGIVGGGSATISMGSDLSVSSDVTTEVTIARRAKNATGSAPILTGVSTELAASTLLVDLKSRKKDDSMASTTSVSSNLGSGRFTPTRGQRPKSHGVSISNSRSMTFSNLSSNSTDLDIYDAKYLSDTVKILPKMDQTKSSKIRDGWSLIKQKRLAMMETVLARLANPITGIQQKKKMLSITKFTLSFSGSEIYEWLVENCKFLVKEEALRFAQELMDCGYLISSEFLEKFDQHASHYIIQHPSLWITRVGQPSDFDYAVSLLKRCLRNNVTDILKFYEEERLDELKKVYHSIWHEAEAKVVSDGRIEKSMKSGDKRMFRVQEASFWKVQRPVTVTTSPGYADESEPADKMAERFTEEEFCDALPQNEQILFLEKKIDQLHISISQNRVKASVSCKSTTHWSSLFQLIDPLLNGANNAWILDDAGIWEIRRTSPKRCEVEVWCNSLQDLFNDPLGFKYFDDFLATEFSQENLHFYKKCQDIGQTASNQEFYEEAKAIYLQFIKVGSPNELNINSNTRSAIIAIFEPKDGCTNIKIPFDCFDDASKHIFSLMAKDSYTRFCNSDLIQSFLNESSTP
ncbi:hypothetical protein BASA50_002809 [Batrachochytrium salamandrivorans]|uniref:RGS domain-containing protein n=1 Tax=Batrachochytrium salamandrivorans TaxID=1357716 RepID=A0ABQ8FKA2_9FUNG|nr:hypothetical protein BASA50_002809 [Batrachochytrium salamandrivorans]